jgi:hypothetical protein
MAVKILQTGLKPEWNNGRLSPGREIFHAKVARAEWLCEARNRIDPEQLSQHGSA